MVEHIIQLGTFLVTIAFFAGVWRMSISALQRRMVLVEEHNNFQDKQIAETHTTSQVILVKLDHICESLAELREEHRIITCNGDIHGR